MPTHVALLRGINVGGGGKVLMADLRQLMTSLGHADVTTYIQSGNVIFTTAEADGAALAEAIAATVAESLNVRARVIVLTRAELVQVVRDCPYPAEPNPRCVHAVFLPADPGREASARIDELVRQAAEQGGRDEATLLGRTLYVHTPDGFGRSDLANALLAKRSSPAAAGTARNWATVTKLLALCEG
jgi:uncharacterized protein (DUF1697 family)